MRDATGTVTGIIGISKDVRAPMPAKEIPCFFKLLVPKLTFPATFYLPAGC